MKICPQRWEKIRTGPYVSSPVLSAMTSRSRSFSEGRSGIISEVGNLGESVSPRRGCTPPGFTIRWSDKQDCAIRLQGDSKMDLTQLLSLAQPFPAGALPKPNPLAVTPRPQLGHSTALPPLQSYPA